MTVMLNNAVEVENGSDYGSDSWRNDHYYDYADIDPDEYDSEAEYMEAVEEKYGWRDYYRGTGYDLFIEHGTMDEYFETVYAGVDWQYFCCLNIRE